MPNENAEEFEEPESDAKNWEKAIVDATLIAEKVGAGVVIIAASVFKFGLLPTAFATCSAVLLGTGAWRLGRRRGCQKKNEAHIKPSPN